MITRTSPRGDVVQLDIGGMTCASCAARIEKRLNRLDGVTASVNYATERAHVDARGGTSVTDLISEVQATGYTARDARPALPRDQSGAATIDGLDEVRSVRDRLMISAVLSAPV